MRADTPARAFVGLGSNLADPVSQVHAGAAALARLPDTRCEACSSLYRTAPVGVTAQPDFVNAVCALTTSLPPEELMRALLDIERAHGRDRARVVAGGPRTLDLDLLLYENRRVHTDLLTLPHPRLHERAFVLYPLAEIAPDLEIPGRGTVASLLPGVGGQLIERLADKTLPC